MTLEKFGLTVLAPPSPAIVLWDARKCIAQRSAASALDRLKEYDRSLRERTVGNALSEAEANAFSRGSCRTRSFIGLRRIRSSSIRFTDSCTANTKSKRTSERKTMVREIQPTRLRHRYKKGASPQRNAPEKLCPLLCPPSVENGVNWYYSPKRSPTENSARHLLTGGLLVRIQPEEPNSSMF